MKAMHSRYQHFFDYGDAEHYRQQIETVRRSFEDIEKQRRMNPPLPPAHDWLGNHQDVRRRNRITN